MKSCKRCRKVYSQKTPRRASAAQKQIESRGRSTWDYYILTWRFVKWPASVIDNYHLKASVEPCGWKHRSTTLH